MNPILTSNEAIQYIFPSKDQLQDVIPLLVVMSTILPKDMNAAQVSSTTDSVPTGQ